MGKVTTLNLGQVVSLELDLDSSNQKNSAMTVQFSIRPPMMDLEIILCPFCPMAKNI